MLQSLKLRFQWYQTVSFLVIKKNNFPWGTTRNKEAGFLLTSKGVRGHFPLIRFRPGLITRSLRLNFPLQPFSRIESISNFSVSPPSYTQHEKATISYRLMKNAPLTPFRKIMDHEQTFIWRLKNLVSISIESIHTSSNRRWTDTYFPPVTELFLVMRSTNTVASVEIGSENLSAS